ncbi:unnamed protein product [Rotaria sp. Silwood2]|nr:unnamed protein product [Rotaria sp. Silwood2]
MLQVVLNDRDKASIAFQIISISCFLEIIIHGIVIQIINPQKFIQLRLLVPLISCLITMILFIFYVALSLTVYSRFSQLNATTNQRRSFHKHNSEINLFKIKLNSQTNSSSRSSSLSHISCLENEQALMFIVFFFIIFMFGVKTSFRYYNYRHYVQLNPPSSLRNLSITIAGLNSKASNEFSEIQLVFWVTKRIIIHVNEAETGSSKQIPKKQCLIVVLTSCVTQGLGWLLSPFISIVGPKVEGVWIIMLYIIARKEHMDETMRGRYKGIPLKKIRARKPKPNDSNTNSRPSKSHNFKSDLQHNLFAELPELIVIRYGDATDDNS